jgi:hypothetical protein
MNKSLFLATIVASLATVFVGVSKGQTTLTLGTVSSVTSVTCPTIGGVSFPTGTACYTGTVTNCPGPDEVGTIDTIGFTYGILNSTGTAGTIVFFNGSDGTGIAQTLNADAVYYSSSPQDFQTVEVVWQSSSGGPAAWEQTQTGTTTPPTSIKASACRPATLLHWIRCGNTSSNTCSSGQTNIYTGGGMCAEGASAGSAAIGYSLAEYGASNYLDNVELMSGPPLSEIDQGCDPANSTQTPTICTGTGTDAFCNNGGEGSWKAPLLYQSPAPSGIDFWTNLTASQQDQPQYCTVNTTYDSDFKIMSIVDGITGSGADSTFDYPDTAMAGWLCAYSPATNSVCGGSNPTGNNTPPEGELFYMKVTANPLHAYRVDSCSNLQGDLTSEGVEGSVSTVPAFYSGGQCPSGATAVRNDMVNNCVPQTHGSRFRRRLSHGASMDWIHAEMKDAVK